MASTNKTPNYDLPLFIDTDKPTWLGDWNGTMTKIDTALEENKSSGESTVGRVTALETTVSEHTDQIATVTQTANTAGATATAAQNAASAASALATTANENAGKAQQTANDINTFLKIRSSVKIPDSALTIASGGTLTYNGLRYAVNSDGTYGKIYGNILVTGTLPSDTVVATIKAGSIPIKNSGSEWHLASAGQAWLVGSNNTPKTLGVGNLTFKADGSININDGIGGGSATDTHYINLIAIPIYFANWGDEPIPTINRIMEMI